MNTTPVAIRDAKTTSMVTMKRESLIQNMIRYWPLYFMALPGMIFFIIFRFIPLTGTIIAFKDYSVFQGFVASPWVGLKHFQTLFQYPDFQRVFFNTLILGMLRVFFFFPVPIILALFINELINPKYKKVIQTVFYIPHFFHG
jgi:putative aldouronate transport system permease protein